MTDDDAADEEMFADLGRFEPGAIPVETVMRQGKAIRLRRRLVGGGALVLAACLVVLAPVVSTTLHGFGRSGSTASPGAEVSELTDQVVPGPPHRIVVAQPRTALDGTVSFSGSIDEKPWSYSRGEICAGPIDHCMDLVGLVLPPVSLLLEPTQDGNIGVSVEFDRNTQHAVMTMSRGEQFTVSAIGSVTGHAVIASGYFEMPRGETVVDIQAYSGTDGSLIGHADPRPLGSLLPTRVPWYRPDGAVLSLDPPTQRLAQGGSGDDAWTLDLQAGSWDAAVVYGSGRGGASDMVSDTLMVRTLHGSPQSVGEVAAAYGLVDVRAKRVDVTFSDGTMTHLTPVAVADGRVFAGTVAPVGTRMISWAQYDASGTLITEESSKFSSFPAWLDPLPAALTGTNS